jgi:hypothetical protein
MGIHSKIAGSDGQLPIVKQLQHFELLEECILSGQMTHVEVQKIVDEDSAFGSWLRMRMRDRKLRFSTSE